jgi:hypothetical protein
MRCVGYDAAFQRDVAEQYAKFRAKGKTENQPEKTADVTGKRETREDVPTVSNKATYARKRRRLLQDSDSTTESDAYSGTESGSESDSEWNDDL